MNLVNSLLPLFVSFVEEIQLFLFHCRNKRLQNALVYEADVIVCRVCDSQLELLMEILIRSFFPKL